MHTYPDWSAHIPDENTDRVRYMCGRATNKEDKVIGQVHEDNKTLSTSAISIGEALMPASQHA